MKTPDDTPVTSSAVEVEVDMAARLAEIKRKAAENASVISGKEVDEREILAQSALGIAERRVARGDFVGTLVWEAIAADDVSPETSTGAGADRFDGTEQGCGPSEEIVPIRQAGRGKDANDEH